jgi:hypothetical protein
LVENGISPATAKDYVASFDGPTLPHFAPWRNELTYTDVPESQGRFLTQSEFSNPADAVSGLDLRPEFGNDAPLRQSVTASDSSIVFEGAIKNSAPGVRETFVIDRSAFQYGSRHPIAGSRAPTHIRRGSCEAVQMSC